MNRTLTRGFLCLAAALFAAPGFMSCDDKLDDKHVPSSFSIPVPEIKLDENKQEGYIEIRSTEDVEWRIVSIASDKQDWLTVDMDKHIGPRRLELSVSANGDPDPRKATLRFEASSVRTKYTHTIDLPLTQMGQAPYMFIASYDPEIFTMLSKYGMEGLEANVKSNVRWTAVAYDGQEGEQPSDWIVITSDASGNSSGKLVFDVKPNTGEERSGRITVRGEHENFTETAVIIVSQVSSANIKTITVQGANALFEEGGAVISLRDPDSGGRYEENAEVVFDGETAMLTFSSLNDIYNKTFIMEWVRYGESDAVSLEARVFFDMDNSVVRCEKYNADFGVFAGEDETNPLVMATADDLKKLAGFVNAGNNYSGVYIKQGGNIALSAAEIWIPIGVSSDVNEWNAFSGIYDGGGYTVSNVYLRNGTTKGQGFFGVIAGTPENKCVIKNLTIEGRGGAAYDIQVTAGGNGCLIGAAIDYCEITNCTNKASIKGAGASTGGLIGHTGALSYIITGASAPVAATSNYILISECHNYGKVEAQTQGNNQNGGLVGCLAAGARLTLSANFGNITTTTNVQRLGGIAGFCNGEIDQCYNTGNITGNSNAQAGIAGWFGPKGKLANCYNTGSFDKSHSSAGGLVGGIANPIGTEFRIASCYNAGGFPDASASGGVIGEVNAPNTVNITLGTVSNLYCIEGTGVSRLIGNNGPSPLHPNIASFMPVTNAYNKMSYEGWDFDTVWTIDEGESLPYLRNNPPQEKPL